MRLKIAFLGAAAALALTAGAETAQADRSRDACRRQINKSEDRLRDAIRNRGPYSERARERRAQLSRVRAQCRAYGWNRGRDDNRWGWGRGRDRDDRWRDRDRRDNDRWRRSRGRTDNVWNRGRNRRNHGWFWSRDGGRHRHSSNGRWCNQRH